MRKVAFLTLALAVSVASGPSAAAATKILVPKYTPETNGFFSGIPIGDLPQITHLPVALFMETNATFDTKVYESVRTTAKPPFAVSFRLVTFVFSSPNTNTPVGSTSEMAEPDELFCTGTNVVRRPGPTSEIPLIRVLTVDRRKKELTADLDLLLGVAPVAAPQDVRYVRRSLRFVYRDGWKED